MLERIDGLQTWGSFIRADCYQLAGLKNRKQQ